MRDQVGDEDDGERLSCETCGESFNVMETPCEGEWHCLWCCDCPEPPARSPTPREEATS